ncbi:MAG: hypothetical protein M1834_002165 [Cirrosporium novae-zelandiae]|nr:MAG: hypothetical protein M1834_002165 [Cirrosporium novae-zelandiae]
MIRTQNQNRIDSKRRAEIDYKKRQFANPSFKQNDYPFRLNFYEIPPTAEITLEQFEQWAIDRLKILAELEACSFRNKSPQETASHMAPLLQKYLPLSSNTSSSHGARDSRIRAERQKDHYSHFILRLAFSGTEDLRRRFSRVEAALFRLRFQNDDTRERQAFVESLNFDWEAVGDEEKREFGEKLIASTPGVRRLEDENWFKVDWERVPELVENRRVFLRQGKAYVPMREQMSMILAEFTQRLDKGLQLTSRALPRLDEDDRLTPILNHLSNNFTTPDTTFTESENPTPGGAPTAQSIDALSQHFPLCMRHLHRHLRENSHLKHYSRLQYTLFLKGLGLSLDQALIFWRQSFTKITDDVFNKEYRYNVRHAYGDVGGDANRRGRGYSPPSCQKILTERAPGPGETHGCPYRHFSPDNLISLLQQTGIHDRDTLKGVREDIEKKRYHIACNRVFDYAHADDIRRAKDKGNWEGEMKETILHPNSYFRKSMFLKHMGDGGQMPPAHSRGDEMEM